MIDTAWLESLNFTGTGGLKYHGLHSLGGESVLLSATLPSGRKVVSKIRRHHLTFYIRELPLFLTNGRPHYDVGRLNAKLFRLVGNPLLDTMTSHYDRLCSAVIGRLEQSGLQGVLLQASLDSLRHHSLNGGDSEDALRFFIRTAGIRRRLAEWAALPPKYERASQGILTVNGPAFPFTKRRQQLISWAAKSVAELEQLPPVLHPDKLPHNPVYVWGAAVTDGFFTNEELPAAVAYVTERFGPLRRHPDAVTYLRQTKALLRLLAMLLKETEGARLAEFARALGFPVDFPSRDSNPAKPPDGDSGSTIDEGDPPDEEVRYTSPMTIAETWELLGGAVAELHTSTQHGDLHPGNWTFMEDQRKVAFFDFSTTKIFDRPLTAEERANDLLPLKLYLPDATWPHICRGYAAKAPEFAAAAFSIVEETVLSLEPPQG